MEVILLLIMLFFVMRSISQEQKNDKERYKIRYDLGNRKQLFVVAVLFTSAAVILDIIVFFSSSGEKWSAEWAAVMLIAAVVVCPLTALAAWLLFWDCCLYLKRLERYGYVLPGNKKAYNGLLNNLDWKKAEKDNDSQSENALNVHTKRVDDGSGPLYSKESVILSVCAFLCGIVILGYAVYFLWKWNILGGNAHFMFGMLVALAVLWGVGGVYYWRQRSITKYRDDVEMDSNRRQRQNLVNGVITIAICMVVSIFIVDVVYYSADYMYHSRPESEWRP